MDVYDLVMFGPYRGCSRKEIKDRLAIVDKAMLTGNPIAGQITSASENGKAFGFAADPNGVGFGFGNLRHQRDDLLDALSQVDEDYVMFRKATRANASFV